MICIYYQIEINNVSKLCVCVCVCAYAYVKN